MQNKLVQKLWLCEPLYLPALRATFLQRKAFKKVALRAFLCAFGADYPPALRATSFLKEA